MTNIDSRWHQIIRSDVLRALGTPASAAIDTWNRLSSQLTPIIGDGGFQSLFERSLHVTCAQYQWIEEKHYAQTEHPFSDLKINLEKRDAAEAKDANVALLITFLDILASLIGNVLTESILRSVWGNDVQES